MTNFPIQSATACRLKWGWSTVFLSKPSTASCHRVNQDKLNLDNISNFHNLPRKIADRQAMLQGQWPGGGCEYCKRIEDAGGFSDRQLHLTDHFNNLTPAELFDNPNAVEVVPTVLEIYFNNTCNLKCLYCGPWFSSKWESEIAKFGEARPGKQWKHEHNPDYDQMVAKLWTWMETNYKSLRAFHILGGEPFMQTELDDCIDFFDQHPNPLMSFVIITNLTISDAMLDRYIAKFQKLVGQKKIARLQISASLDCWGPQQEYVRSGLNLAQWKRNFEKLLQLRWVNLHINHALSGLTIKTLPDLLDHMNEWSKVRPIFSSFMTVQDPAFMNPSIFGPNVFTDDFAIINSKMPDYSEHHKKFKEHMFGIGKEIEAAKPNIPLILDLKAYLETLDARRNTDYKLLFPWLKDIFDQYET